MKVLVTGGAGFIGSHLVRALLERGDRVVVLDNFSSGRRSNLDELAGEIELVEGDLRSYERVHAAMGGVELVFHEGALPSVPRSVQDPLTTNEVNVSGTLNVLLAARDEPTHMPAFTMTTTPTPLQRRAFELLDVSHRHGLTSSVSQTRSDHKIPVQRPNPSTQQGELRPGHDPGRGIPAISKTWCCGWPSAPTAPQWPP